MLIKKGFPIVTPEIASGISLINNPTSTMGGRGKAKQQKLTKRVTVKIHTHTNMKSTRQIWKGGELFKAGVIGSAELTKKSNS